MFGWLDFKIEEDVEELNGIEDIAVNIQIDLSQDDGERRRLEHDKIWRNLHFKESMIKQKARIKWIKERDNNTKYFHFMLKAKLRRNSIV